HIADHGPDRTAPSADRNSTHTRSAAPASAATAATLSHATPLPQVECPATPRQPGKPGQIPGLLRGQTAHAPRPRGRALRAFHHRRARSARTRAAAPEPWRTANRAAAAGKRPPGLREPDAVPAPPAARGQCTPPAAERTP